MDWSASGEDTGRWRQCLEEIFAELLALRGVPGGITVDYSRDAAGQSLAPQQPLTPMRQAEVFFRSTNWRKEIDTLRKQAVFNLPLRLALMVLIAVFGVVLKPFPGLAAGALIAVVLALLAGELAQQWLAGRTRARMEQMLSTASLYELWLASLARGTEFYSDLQQRQVPWMMALFGARTYPAKLKPAVRFMVADVEWFASQPRLRHNVEWIRLVLAFSPATAMLIFALTANSAQSFALMMSLMLVLVLLSSVCGMYMMWYTDAWIDTAVKKRILLTYLLEHLCNQLQRDAAGCRETLISDTSS